MLNELADIQRVIDGIEFHDLQVDGIRFGLADASITLEVHVFDDADKEHAVTVTFHRVGELSLQDHDLMRVEEITHCELVAEGEVFRMSILFLCGFAGPGLEMSFTFSAMSVNGWPIA